MTSVAKAVHHYGFAIVPDCFDPETLDELRKEFSSHPHGVRNLLAISSVQRLARSKIIHSLVTEVLGENAFAVRGTLFDKLPDANWKVPWHQDRVIPVRERLDAPGFRLWSVKEGVVHVQPPVDVMEQILAVRIHLDDVDEGNGPLRVIPGSHTAGYISDSQLDVWKQKERITCVCTKGSILLMRPLLLHASSQCSKPDHRRVIHLEFTTQGLPGDLQWNMRV